jgi:uncharacterized membrane protein
MLSRLFGAKERQSAFVKHWPWTLAGILLLALALRLINIGAEPYWADEVLSLDIATKSAGVGEIWRYISQVEFHPPFYYLILRFWAATFGEAEAATRSLSLLFSLGTIALAYLSGRRLFRSSAVGLWAAAVLAVLPIQVEYGQEARPYSMMCFFGIAAMLCLWEYLQSRRPLFAGLYVSASLIGVYLHYSFAFIPLALAGWWLLCAIRNPHDSRSRDFVWWLTAHAAMFLGFFPWLTPFLYKLNLGAFEIYGLARNVVPFRTPDLSEFIMHQLIWLTKETSVTQIEILAAFAFQALFVWALVVFVRNIDRRRDQGRAASVKYLLWMIFVPFVMFLASRHSVPYSTIYMRHVLFITVPFALLLGCVAVAVPRRLAAMLMAVFFVSLVPAVSRVVANDALWDYDFRLEEAAATINEQYREGDLVLTTVACFRSDMQHYLRPEIPVAALVPTNFYDGDIWNDRFRLGLVENEMQVRIKKASRTEINERLRRLVEDGGYRRVWLYPFNIQDIFVHEWFQNGGWRWVYRNTGDILRLDMYSLQ